MIMSHMCGRQPSPAVPDIVVGGDMM